MNEMEKCLNGEWYDCHAHEFLEMKKRARSLLARYNALSYDQWQEKREVLEALLGRLGQRVSIGLPFLCDYGCNIEIEDQVSINMNCTFVDCNKISIGGKTLISSNVQIYTATHPADYKERFTPGWQPGDARYFCRTKALPVTIGQGCFIGGGTIILPGVSIGDFTTVGAGSVVAKSLPPKVVAAGNPCRILRSLE